MRSLAVRPGQQQREWHPIATDYDVTVTSQCVSSCAFYVRRLETIASSSAQRNVYDVKNTRNKSDDVTTICCNQAAMPTSLCCVDRALQGQTFATSEFSNCGSEMNVYVFHGAKVRSDILTGHSRFSAASCDKTLYIILFGTFSFSWIL